jgi:NADH-quinone oxidoreductase subunit M
MSLLSWLISIPLLGGLALAFWPKLRPEPARLLTFGLMSLTFLLSLPLFGSSETAAEMLHGERCAWIPALGIDYHVGADGISSLLILLTTLLAPLVLLSSYGHVQERVRQYCVLLLLMEAGMIGVFAALDLILFYVFFEMSLVPLYLLIGIYGGKERLYAAFKFFVFTMAGSLFMLLAILYLMHQAGSSSYLAVQGLELSLREELFLFASFAVAFAVKVPLVPLHTWLPDAHVQAPTGGSVILAGVTLKMGTYGLLRFALPLFPRAAVEAAPLLLVLAVIGILYGALLAWAQKDLKRLIAYSSISHLGFVVLGIFALTLQSASGSVLQMLNHGLSTGALFLLIGMIYERAHTRGLHDFGGLAKTMPRFATCLIIATLSSIGLPGLNGFIGEFLILVGAFGTRPLLASLATVGVLLGAIYMLGLVKAVLFGPIRNRRAATYSDLGLREVGLLTPILVLVFWIGFYPAPLLERIEPAVERMLEAPLMTQATSAQALER